MRKWSERYRISIGRSSRSTRRFYIGGAALALILATAAFAADAPPVGPKAETPAVAKSPETTTQRLLDADKEQQNWITHHNDYSAQRFSTLDQINAGNVKDLKVAWTMQLGGVEGGGIWSHGGLEGTPIVEDGFMYVTDGWGSVYKIDTHGGKGTPALEDGPQDRPRLGWRGRLLRRR